MARSHQAGSRNNNYNGARRSGAYGQSGHGQNNRAGRGYSAAPQYRSAIREGQGILGWFGTMARWVILIILVMVFIKYARQAYAIGYGIFAEETVAADGQGENVTVTITAAMTVDEIGQLLEDSGVLVDGSVFQYQERFSSYHGDIQPGTYTLSTDMTPTEILKAISVTSGEDTTES